MTRFERDLREVKKGDHEVFVRRAKEITELKKELRCCKNGFRATCIMQDLERLERDYDKLEKARKY